MTLRDGGGGGEGEESDYIEFCNKVFCELKEARVSSPREFTAFLPMGASLEAEVPWWFI